MGLAYSSGQRIGEGGGSGGGPHRAEPAWLFVEYRWALATSSTSASGRTRPGGAGGQATGGATGRRACTVPVAPTVACLLLSSTRWGGRGPPHRAGRWGTTPIQRPPHRALGHNPQPQSTARPKGGCVAAPHGDGGRDSRPPRRCPTRWAASPPPVALSRRRCRWNGHVPPPDPRILLGGEDDRAAMGGGRKERTKWLSGGRAVVAGVAPPGRGP